jgi:hypothetical protein
LILFSTVVLSLIFIAGVLVVFNVSVDDRVLSFSILAAKAFPMFVDGTTDRALDSYAKRLTLNVIDTLDSTQTSDALSANQGRILLANINNRANSTGDAASVFNVATATASTHATNKSYVDTGLATKASQAYVNSQAQSISLLLIIM